MVCSCLGVTESVLVTAVLTALRGEAQRWASQQWRSLRSLSFGELSYELRCRFAQNKETAEVVSRFFTAPQSRSYKEYMCLLKDATLLYRRKAVCSEALMKQLIVRSPGDIKSLLLQAASVRPTWAAFIKSAEDSAWIAFPERIVNEVNIEGGSQQQDEEAEQAVSAVSINNNQLYCHLHGKGKHSTSQCEVVKLVESKGWTRVRKEHKHINKNSSSYIYSTFNKVNKIVSLFKKELTMQGKKYAVLLDTRADVSLIKNEWVPSDCKIMADDTRIRGVSGAPVKVEGRVVLKFAMDGVESKEEFLVTDNVPNDHIILGAKWIMTNKHCMGSILGSSCNNRISDRLNKEVKSVEGNSVEELKQLEAAILNEYNDIFQAGLTPKVCCPIIKHSIDTGKARPVAKRTYPIPYQ